MYEKVDKKVWVVIPAFNEENSVGKVIQDLPRSLVEEIIVVNNNSNDRTSEVARNAGAIVLDEKIPGYGRACLKGMNYLKERAEDKDVVVFLDADYSDHPEQITRLIDPILEEKADFVVGSREKGEREMGSMTFPQRFGNKLAAQLIRIRFGKSISDLGPFRAITYESLMALDMKDKTYGWTVEMQIKGFNNNLRYMEVPVDYRKRIGFSKISGTLKGTVLAGYKIIATIYKYSKA